MTTRVDYMAALKSAWERAPSEPEKAAAKIKFEGRNRPILPGSKRRLKPMSANRRLPVSDPLP